jgi:hypothetical protein
MHVISGVVLVVIGGGSYWYLLPRKGQVHPLVQNSDIGSMITIGIMTVLTAGFALFFAGLFA